MGANHLLEVGEQCRHQLVVGVVQASAAADRFAGVDQHQPDLMALDELKKRGMEDCFTLLHFHLGSQITNIRQVKAALNEAARVYTELVGRGAGLKYLDVGGGPCVIVLHTTQYQLSYRWINNSGLYFVNGP